MEARRVDPPMGGEGKSREKSYGSAQICLNLSSVNGSEIKRVTGEKEGK